MHFEGKNGDSNGTPQCNRIVVSIHIRAGGVIEVVTT